MLRNGINVISKKGLHYIVEDGGRLLKFKPWLGDAFSFLYDFIMKSSIFPKKFGGDMNQHYEILSNELKGAHQKRVLELATGSGSAVNFLPNDNQYTGTDISPCLLKQAENRFRKAGFPAPEFYVVSADDLPFENGAFDLCLCILSLNFVGNVERVFEEVRRVLVAEGVFVCTVPVPERNKLESTIRGTLYSEAELERACQDNGLSYETIPSENGALLYFRAIKQ